MGCSGNRSGVLQPTPLSTASASKVGENGQKFGGGLKYKRSADY